ncbi:metalloregulator ArsR/SmtB family transcription factor [Williamsia sp.]|uniref:ArsR/SmtB family transcription factor n=1 Tax=Williamsia sp. TaxID=1872085 RepID=UPI001A2AC26F|nr:metalloregulator ArsR/SmtB family transcription factor [Williamsia sp.]MBJ7289730.1 winged helix-turn-helix transcriptional regulator [Williamsia sp.]
MSDRDDRLDRAFLALADPVRRAIIARLSRGPAGVNDLAAPFDISLQAVSRHVGVLEQAGLVTRTREAQRRPVHLAPERLEELTAWIDRHRLVHEQQFRALDSVLTQLSGDQSGEAPAPPAQSPSREEEK